MSKKKKVSLMKKGHLTPKIVKKDGPDDLIMVNWSEFIQLTMRFYLLLAAQISNWRAHCRTYITFKQILLEGPC